jgi:transcriptional regulator with XRE-family HTH domain
VSAAEEAAFVRALGACVRMLRLAQRLSQEQLAAMTGLSRPFVCQVERGNHAPNVLNLRRIAVALRVPLAVLVDEAADPSPAPGVPAVSRRAGLDGPG